MRPIATGVLALLPLAALAVGCGERGAAPGVVPTAAAEETRRVDPVLDAPATGDAGGVVYTALADRAPMRFVSLSGGEFTRGSDPAEQGHQPWEAPRHRAAVEPFLIAETEVTEAHWQAVRGGTGGDARPRGSVTWCDAVQFANALSRVEGLTEAYSGAQNCAAGGAVTWLPGADGFRLPTEAEWEFAARAGTATRFWSGDTDDDLLRVGAVDRNAADREPVGRKAANAFGLYDVHGNVWEWVWDPFVLYGDEPVPAPELAPGGARRVARGGGYWHGSVRGARAASRNAMLEGRAGRDWCRDIGLRLARTAAREEP